MRALALVTLLACNGADKTKPRRWFDVSFGSVECSEIAQWECGMTLWDCTDGAVYRCLQNVRMRKP